MSAGDRYVIQEGSMKDLRSAITVVDRLSGEGIKFIRENSVAGNENTDAATCIRDAMQDLLTSPMGVIPTSADSFYDGNEGRFSTTKVQRLIEK